MYGVPWTNFEISIVREYAGRIPTSALAWVLGRTTCSMYQRITKEGLQDRRRILGPAFDTFLRARHSEGWSDAEIAVRMKVSRSVVSKHRRRMGLPHNALSERRRRKVARKTRAQLRAAGLPSIGWLRKKAHERFAVQSGWPADLRPRAVQILNTIWDRGPMTRKELATSIGMRTEYRGKHAIRKILKSNDPEGSYTANLIARGLLVCLPRAMKVVGRGRGRSCHVYSLPLTIERRKVNQHAA